MCLLDGIFLIRGPEVRAVLLGSSVSLVCAVNIASNPEPSVTWLDPLGRNVTTTGTRHRIVTNSRVASLDFARTFLEDNGEWTCRVRVEGTNVQTPQGVVPSALVGEQIVTIHLKVVGE